MHESRRGPLKGAMSAQKALRGSETNTRELLVGTEENSLSPLRGHWFALANQGFFTKRKQKKIKLVARPGSNQCWGKKPPGKWTRGGPKRPLGPGLASYLSERTNLAATRVGSLRSICPFSTQIMKWSCSCPGSPPESFKVCSNDHSFTNQICYV